MKKEAELVTMRGRQNLQVTEKWTEILTHS